MARCLRSTNFARADLTCASSRINCSTPQSAATAALHAAMASMPISTRIAGLIPVIMEIEPVIRGQPAIMLETADVLSQRVLDRIIASRAVDLAEIGERLEADIVTVAAAINSEHQHHRPFEQRGDAERSVRESPRRAQEPAANRAFVARRP